MEACRSGRNACVSRAHYALDTKRRGAGAVKRNGLLNRGRLKNATWVQIPPSPFCVYKRAQGFRQTAAKTTERFAKPRGSKKSHTGSNPVASASWEMKSLARKQHTNKLEYMRMFDENNIVVKPSVQTVAKIAKALGVSIENLL